MYLTIHVPMFGSTTIDSKPIECPKCPRRGEHGANDWVEKPIGTCDRGDTFECARCGTVVTINWGLVEPDHLSSWLNAEHCPHRLCMLKAAEVEQARLAPA